MLCNTHTKENNIIDNYSMCVKYKNECYSIVVAFLRYISLIVTSTPISIKRSIDIVDFENVAVT